MKAFNEHWFGSWVINGFAVVAFILALKLAIMRLPDNIPFLAAFKGAVSAV